MRWSSLEVESDDSELAIIDVEAVTGAARDRPGEGSGENRLAFLQSDAKTRKPTGQPHDAGDRVVLNASGDTCLLDNPVSFQNCRHPPEIDLARPHLHVADDDGGVGSVCRRSCP